MNRIENPFLDPAIPGRLLSDPTVLFAALLSDGTIAWISEASQFLLGREPETLAGTNGLLMLHPDDQEVVVESMLEPARGSAERVRVPLRLSHADGHWVNLEFGGVDMRDHDGSGYFLIWGSPHDPTGRLLEFLNRMLAGASLSDLMEQVVTWQDSTMPGTASTILVRERDGLYHRLAGTPRLPAALAFDVDPDGGPSGPWLRAADGREEAAWSAVEDLPSDLARLARGAGFASVWSIAVHGGLTRRAQALVVLWRHHPGPMLATQRQQLRTTAQVVQLGLQWSINQRELVTAATTDPLTGLANRTQLDARIRADGSGLAAVLFCDLDDFKQVNDRYGHLVGDRILREAATRMTKAIRGHDLLVRLGGDEFAVWCPALRSPADAEAVAARLVRALEVPVDIDGRPHVVGCSIGVAVVRSDDGMAGNVDRILGSADQALYLAKRAGKGRYAVDRGIDSQLPFDR